MNKKIDVIIPAYKAHNTIARTLSSIAMQSIVDKLAVIIVNDADDDYSEFVKHFSSYMDIREIKLEENGGPGIARQFGIDNSDSQYFTCIDADDTFAGAFSLELMLKQLESDREAVMCSGSFAEQQEDLQFILHQQDMVWMFGKLYRRSFINNYKIKFNDTRANEDNGFNTMIRLLVSETEKIIFLQDVVYYWHYKADSITRINNAEYSYNQSFVGYTDNMIYAIKEAKKRKPFNQYIDMWAIQVMYNLYNYYYQTVKRDSRFIEQNYKCCIKYYSEIFYTLKDKYDDEFINSIFSQTMIEQAVSMQGVVPNKSIYDFIEQLEKERVING